MRKSNSGKPLSSGQLVADENGVSAEENGVSAEVVVLNPLGFHTRPCTLVAKQVIASGCSVEFTCLFTGESSPGNSILGLLSLGAARGTPLRIQATGTGAAELLASLIALFQAAFNEEQTDFNI